MKLLLIKTRVTERPKVIKICKIGLFTHNADFFVFIEVYVCARGLCYKVNNFYSEAYFFSFKLCLKFSYRKTLKSCFGRSSVREGVFHHVCF